MKSFRPWQVVLMVAAVLVLAGSLWWSFRAKGPAAVLTHRMMLVDVVTGELFTFSTKSRTGILPAKHPDNGTYTLIPAVEGDGGWRVAERALPLLQEMIDSKSVERSTLAVDPQSGTFTPKGSPRSAN